ncbi:MAG TPA: NAD(P)H-hydrate dehydratase [Abditibacteriaceae bacterium]|jgi:NAD(P)H-hydrate epimerase
MKVFTAQQMRDFDRAATDEYSIPSIVLMENAALRVVEFLEMKFAPLKGKRILILCGKGNNGGDGFAIARHLKHYAHAIVLVPADTAAIKGDALINYQILEHTGTGTEITDEPVRGLAQWAEIEVNKLQPDIVIDAMLGTGFSGELKDLRVLKGLHLINESCRPIVAVDIPTGLNSDTGEAAPDTVKADYTITFAAPKCGMFLREGVEHCGEIWVGDIGTSQSQMWKTETGGECITRGKARGLAPYRSLDAHKGDAGRVVICGGSYGMSGAPTLASKAALRIGAGLCITCLPDKVLPMFASAFSEATSHPLVCDDEGRLLPSAADAVLEYSKGANVLAIGPGLSRSPGALDFARLVITETPLPVVVDADALYALRAIESPVKARQAATILTPHPGEMGELMQMSVADVQNDRLGVALACAQKFNAIVVLKGARSVVALPDGRTFFNLTGNPGMATGGSGDVLTGTIAGLLAQTKDAERATLLGVYLHGLAGDIEYSTKGNGLIAGDIAEALPRAMLQLQEPQEHSANGRLRRLQ